MATRFELVNFFPVPIFLALLIIETFVSKKLNIEPLDTKLFKSD